MPRPIPVFAFVFAAFAATNANGVLQSLLAARSTRRTATPGGEEAYNHDLSSPRPKHFCVKIRVSDLGSASQPRFAPSEAIASGEFEDVWLGEIVETTTGYSGVVCQKPTRLADLRLGDSLSFQQVHVVDDRLQDQSVSAETPLSRLAARGKRLTAFELAPI